MQPAELEALKSYIASRGFKDEGTGQEILDHFACKVEELLSADPSTSFEAAVAKAHASFGIRGFRDLADGYAQRLERKYNALYRDALKTALVDPLFLILAACIGYNVFRLVAQIRAEGVTAVPWAGFIGWGVLLFTGCLELVVWRRIPAGGRKSLIIRSALTPGGFYLLPFWIIPFIGNDGDSSAKMIAGIVAPAFLLLFSLLHLKARLKTLAAAREEYALLQEAAGKG